MSETNREVAQNSIGLYLSQAADEIDKICKGLIEARVKKISVILTDGTEFTIESGIVGKDIPLVNPTKKYPIARQNDDGQYEIIPNLPEAEYHVMMDVPYTLVCLTCQTPLSTLETCMCNLPDRQLALISEKTIWPDQDE